MKKPVSIMLLIILICSACFPSFAQSSRRIRSRFPADADYATTVAEYQSIRAYSDGQGVFIRWEMRSELNNIGFFVYRLGSNGFELITPNSIMGSYAKVRGRVLEGETYEYYDPYGALGSIYFIRNHFVDGNELSSYQFSPRYTADFFASTGHSKAELEGLAHNTNNRVRRDSLALSSDLQAAVDRSTLPPNPEGQSYVVTQQGVKIAVQKEGMYRVTRSELQGAGFDVNSDPANWRLFTEGNEQAIIVEPTGQYVDFYGKGLDLRETDTRTYYLIADTVAGKRIISKFLGNIGGNVVSNNFRAAIELKERTIYQPKIRNGDEENYFGRGVYPSLLPCPNPNPSPNNPPCLSVTLDQIDPNGPNAIATLRMQSFTPDHGPHTTRMVWNGHEIGQIDGSDSNPYSGDLSMPASFLIEGENTPQLATVQPSNVDFFNSIKITYSRKYQASQNRLLFSTPGYRKINVNGFASANIRVFDATLDGNPQLITDLPITANGSTYSVRMPSNRPAVMYAVEDSGLLHSPSIAPDNPSTLATANNQADMIIISHAALMAGAEAWANYRRTQAGGGFTVKVMDVVDIYDEFSYGNHSGAAVNRFLEYANSNWQNPKPRYALLIGDGSTDPRNYGGFGDNDLVPSKNVNLIYEETYSDEALADFDHNGVGDIAIGRIPARSVEVVNTVLNKTMIFETPANQSLGRGALFANDVPRDFDFRAMSLFLADQLPSTMPRTFVSRGDIVGQPDPQAHTNLINALNTGMYIVNYSGHGSNGTWASADFFSVNDVQSLTNASRPSIFTMLTCFNGFFIWDRSDSLGEALLKAPNGGAAATWSSTTETTPDYQMTMGARFYLKTGVGNIKRIGDLIIDAKTVIAGSDVGYSWALLGDPALKVRE